MNKSESFYLDFLRVVAAFGVLLVHANLPWYSNGLFIRPEMGHKLVMVFFVLSGYLIAFTVKQKNKGAKQYFVDRFSRLYSVVLPALILTYVLDLTGKYFHPSNYSGLMAGDHHAVRFVVNSLFLSQIWGFCVAPATNVPFWSVAYEFWYYLMFGVLCYLSGAKRIAAAIVIGFIVGIKILLLLPVWFLGVAAYHYSSRLKLSATSAAVIFWGSMFGIVALSLLGDISLLSKAFPYGRAPLFFSSQFLFDWGYGALIAVNLFCLQSFSSAWKAPLLLENIVKYLASVTFTLYLLHIPLLNFCGAFIPYDRSSYLQTLAILAGIVGIVCIISQLTEKKRAIWKIVFSRLVPG